MYEVFLIFLVAIFLYLMFFYKTPVDARWTAWTEWGECVGECGDETETRSRTCIEGRNGGKTCTDLGYSQIEKQTRTCSSAACNRQVLLSRRGQNRTLRWNVNSIHSVLQWINDDDPHLVVNEPYLSRVLGTPVHGNAVSQAELDVFEKLYRGDSSYTVLQNLLDGGLMVFT